MKGRLVANGLSSREREKLIRAVNAIDFKGMEGYHAGASLIVLLEFFDIERYSYTQLWNVPLYADTYHVKDDKNGQVMFLFSNSYKGRCDHKKWFLKLTKLLDKKLVVLPTRGEVEKVFSVQEKVQMGIWFLQMGKIPLTMKEKLLCVNLLMSGKRNLEEIIGIIIKRKVRSIVTLADVHLIDYLVTVYCNRKGITTVTLQHGFYLEDDVFFRYSESDYFLTYSEYTKQLANKHQKQRGVYVAIGMPDYIGEKKVTTRGQRKREHFLVLLNSSDEKEHRNNMRMLKTCVEYAEKNDCYFEVKPHPGTKYLYEYQAIVSKRGKFVKENLNVSNLFDNYEFCVANTTTMVLKAIFVLTPVLLFRSKGEKSFFGLENSRLNFSDDIEMEQAISYIKEDCIEGDLIEIREFLCGSGTITNNYQKFLEKL